jgi:hypothetical protein
MYLHKKLHPISTTYGHLQIFYIPQNQKGKKEFSQLLDFEKNIFFKENYFIVSRFTIKKMYSIFFSQIIVWN